MTQSTKNSPKYYFLAFKYDMPSTGGMNIETDRLVVLLTGAESIRAVILFPSLK
jgi:lysyl-tRNA synthetase class 2